MKRLKRHRVTFPYPEVPVLYAMCDGEDVAQLESKCAKLEALNAELLEALEGLAMKAGRHFWRDVVVTQARAAIAKAKGEEL